ncbi:unnamed protein product [Meganyctiphanes norvegica]|uniref:Uncharacterized protein n=1 Tax=Meganyctiphanes norvegica TaxID=48144 RepID=A0AAV2QDX9_MEGNR
MAFNMWKKLASENMFALLHSLKSILSGDWVQNMALGINMILMFFVMDAINYKYWSVQDILSREYTTSNLSEFSKKHYIFLYLHIFLPCLFGVNIKSFLILFLFHKKK